MIPNNKTGVEIETFGDTDDSLTAGISTENMAFLFDLVSNQMYKNPIESIVREITSNCFDSHIEAKVQMPVRIKMGENEAGDYISFSDFGVGMSPDRMKNTYINYFSSTKRNTNDQIGTFGLGSKSPLAYSDSFFITTISDGIEYEYMFHKGTELPTLELLSEEPTTKGNGTTIRIQLKSYGDVVLFKKALKNQLCYFDEIYYEGCDIDNNYRILEGNYFKYRNSFQYSTQLHIVIGKVAYPIDWDEVGQTAIYLPMALKFNIGELNIVPSRESIRYDEETRKTINSKISLLIGEISKKYNAQDGNKYDELYSYLHNLRHDSTLLLHKDEDGEVRVDLTSFYVHSKKEVIFTPFPEISRTNTDIYDSSSFFSCFTAIKQSNRNGNIIEAKHSANYYFRENYHVIFLDKDMEKVKNLYLKSKGNFVLIKWSKKSYQEWKKFFRFKSGEVGLMSLVKRFKIAIFKNLIDNSTDYRYQGYNFHKYTDIVVDQAWLETYNEGKKKKKVKILGEVPVKLVSADGGLSERTLKLDELSEYKGFIIYGFRKDRERLGAVSSILSSRYSGSAFKDKQGKQFPYKVVLITAENHKYFKQKNMAHIDQITPNVRIFRNIVTVLKIKKVLEGYSDNERFAKVLTSLYPTIGAKLTNIQEFVENNLREMPFRSNGSTDMLQELYDIAEQYNLWNHFVMIEVKQVEEYINKAPLLLTLDYDKITKDRTATTIEFYEPKLFALANYLKKCGNHVDSRWFVSSLPAIEEPSSTGDEEIPQVTADVDAEFIPVESV